MSVVRLERVSYTTVVTTECPIGGLDINEVVVTFEGGRRFIEATDIGDLIAGFAHETLYAEDLALAIGRAVGDKYGLCRVSVRQLEGQGVRADVTATP